MAQFVDGIVDGRVFFYIGVRGRYIGFGLVVVVVGNKVFNRIVGEYFAKLAEELSSQGFVGRQYQGRALDSGHHLGHGEGLARTGDAEKYLIPHPSINIGNQLINGLRLITGRSEVGNQGEGGGIVVGGGVHNKSFTVLQ